MVDDGLLIAAYQIINIMSKLNRIT